MAQYSDNQTGQTGAFSACHPVVNLLFFTLAAGVPMWLMHPVLLTVSFAAALLYARRLYHDRLPFLRAMIPAAVLVMLINVLFHHRGVTVLMILPSGNALTLESAAYGFAAAVMMLAVMLWFACLNVVMPPDKFVYLFGRMAPLLSMLLSMTLRFVPLFYQRFRQVEEAQRGLGRYLTEGSLRQRLGCAVSILSILLAWAMENAVITADSMKGRGYGLPGRTAFSIYRFDRRDIILCSWLGFCGVYMVCAAAAGQFIWNFYPAMSGAGMHLISALGMVLYALLCLTPLYLEWREERIWRRCKFEI